MIGNSLSNDSRPDRFGAFWNNDRSIMTVDTSIVSSAHLTQQWAGEGAWAGDLASQAFGDITFQPSFGTGVTLGTEETALEGLVAAALAGPSTTPRLYIYEGWPPIFFHLGDYQAYWDEAVVDDDATLYVQKRQAVDHLLARARANIDSNFHVIPTGAVLREIDVQARLGNLPGIATVDDIYRDDVHMGDVGHWAAAVTIYSTVQGKKLEDTERWRLYRAIGDGNVRLSYALSQQIIDIVWDVVSNDPRTGVTP